MEALDVRYMCLEPYDQAFRQQIELLFQTFAIAHDELTWGKVPIYDAESQTSHQP
jgi:hypothetical protein